MTKKKEEPKKTAKKPAKRGRKDKYETHVKPYFEEIKMMKVNGYDDIDIAKAIGINKSTFAKYKAEKKEFRELIEKANVNLELKVVDALAQRAVGIKYTEKKKTVRKKGNEVVFQEIVETEKFLPPDVGAIALYMKRNNIYNTAEEELTKARIRKANAETDMLTGETQGEDANNWAMGVLKLTERQRMANGERRRVFDDEETEKQDESNE